MAIKVFKSNWEVLDYLGISAVVAAGTRKLRGSYTGNCMRIRRSSDNAELDIGFNSSGGLDTVAALAHCGAGNGFVSIWYDQGENGYNLLQADTAKQPQIVSSGAILTDNGKASVNFVSTKSIQAVAVSSSQPFTRSFVVNRKENTAVGSGAHYVSSYDSNPNTTDYCNSSTQLNMYAGASPDPLLAHNFALNESAIFAGVYNLAASNHFKNGSKKTGTVSTQTVSGLRIGTIATSPFTGASFGMNEVFFFLGAMSDANVSVIQKNQGNYYGITVT